MLIQPFWTSVLRRCLVVDSYIRFFAARAAAKIAHNPDLPHTVVFVSNILEFDIFDDEFRLRKSSRSQRLNVQIVDYLDFVDVIEL